MYTIHDGTVLGARQVASPNFSDRPEGCTPDLLVIHNISLPPGQYGGDCIERFFCNTLDCNEHPYFVEIAGMEVSAHLLIRRCGELVQFVNLNDRAWHAGRSAFGGRQECNDFGIGVELEGTDDEPYSDDQYAVLAQLSRALMASYPALAPERIVGHCDIAPGRKTDPGPAFDWPRYRATLNPDGARQ